MEIKFLENEFWYGSCVKYGVKMPFTMETKEVVDFTINRTPNQAMPLLLSTKGRVIWRDRGYKIEFDKGKILVPDDCTLEVGGNNLKEGYLYAMRKYFPFRDKTPARELFEKVVYNSWIELTFYQNEKDILKYVRKIVDSGMEIGVLMIDDGWAEYYGDWRFHNGKFPNPKEMLEEIKKLGFRVMVWVCPFITPDSVKFRECQKKGLLVKNSKGETLITRWWNGYSAVLDFSNPETSIWLGAQLDELQKLGVDGFKFDAGDSIYYNMDDINFGNITPDEQSKLWAEFGEKYPFNEYRVTFKAGGYALMQRLCDKAHSWGVDGVASLIPDTLLQGLTGHPYGSPDMIGGGEYLNFIDMNEERLDQELFVRHSEIACLMPAMQFSAAPYRVLNKENFEAILNSIEVRKKYIGYLLELLDNVPITGEPIVRYMAYEFPNDKVEEIIDQFMLGQKYLVAPVYEKNREGREVYLPQGKWLYKNEELISKGEKRYFKSDLGIPVILERI